MKPLGRVTAALLLVILVMGGLIALVYVTGQATIGSQSSTMQQQSQSIQGQASMIQSQSSALQKDQKSLTALEANITTTEKALRQDQAEVASMNATISADQSKIAAISSGYSQANATVASLRAEVDPIQAQVTSLQANVTALQGQIAGFKAQISTLQSQVTALSSIASLGQSKILLSQQFVGVPSLGNQVAVTFVANYSGYVTVSMTKISDINAVQAGVIIFFGASVNSGPQSSEPIGPFSFASIPDSIIFPVTPGSITVFLANNANSPGNATLTVTYYY